MKDLRSQEDSKKLRKSILKTKLLRYIIRNRWWILLFLILGMIIVFPSLTGDFVGKFTHNFYINIIKHYK